MKPVKLKDIKKGLVDYAVAPYNFVSFPKKAVSRYKEFKELPAHNDFKGRKGEKLLTGYIEYTLKAETPIIVSKGNENKGKKLTDAYFFVNPNGKYAIPGNTIRGMLRTNCQILSFSNIVGGQNKDGIYENSEIEDSRFLYRDVAGNNSLSKKYFNVLGINPNIRIAKNLKAGYIVNRAGRYYIIPAKEIKKGIPYFRIDEIALRKIISNKNIEGINLMYTEEILKHEDEINELKKEIKEIGKNKRNINKFKELNRELKNKLKGLSNEKYYKPYQIEISFNIDNKNNKITDIDKKGICSNNGYLLSGGFILGKLSHYIVPEIDDKSNEIEISKEDIEAYKDDLIRTKKMNKKDEISEGKEFFALPKEKNHIKPVFYINTDRLHFGFTPFLRVSYTKTILDGVPHSYKNTEGISYTEAIFGFSKKIYKRKDKENEKVSYKSRVSFEDAEVVGKALLDEDSVMKMLLAEPKPTSYNLYLKQDKDADKKQLNIYEDNFEIRGFKQYWLKDYIESPNLKEGTGEDMKFTIHPLKEGSIFKGRIYFTNLYEDELGLLIWSLKLNEDCYQNIGLAKPYGFGRVKVEGIKLFIEDLNKKYNYFSFDYFKEENALDYYIEKYKKYFSDEFLNRDDIENKIPIKEFIKIKSKIVTLEEANNYRYMDLDSKEFQSKKVLPEILEYEETLKDNNSKRYNGDKKDIKDIRKNKNKVNVNKGTTMAEAFEKAQKKK
ncbi:MAG: TIGR03986 family CRISPR-associated RAMP protein [Thermoanaerobacteraceae bacterium]|nr:TIGR03986 family CRISPR-associated RAMP protein [Thermoanaerobacteraceae bacterium]